MGQNRTLATPESYPAAFLSSIENGAGIMYSWDLPWTTCSAAKRFRLLLALLRKTPSHRLHTQAVKRWSVRYHSKALEVSLPEPSGRNPELHAVIVGRALAQADGEAQAAGRGNRGKP